MLSLNEAHNMRPVIENLRGWAQEIFLVDSYSSDETVDIALAHGVHVVQRPFRGFGDQWNFAVTELPITAPWTMKLDPDERLSPGLKQQIARALEQGKADGLTVDLRLWFMGKRLPVRQSLLRLWRTGAARFRDVAVNEHPAVQGRIERVSGDLEHHDSPDLHHWFDKQNRYSTVEALARYRGEGLPVTPRISGSPLERRMWLKRCFRKLPLRSLLVFAHAYLWKGAWRAGRVGFIWATLRVHVYRMDTLKLYEMRRSGRELKLPPAPRGAPHPGAIQARFQGDGGDRPGAPSQ
jgi:glycosyltransferase involved in cell wall biosynthesis